MRTSHEISDSTRRTVVPENHLRPGETRFRQPHHSSDGDDVEEVVEGLEVVGVAGVEGEADSDGDGGDE